ncbi:tRNA-guanosine(34) transglycosylase [candidate division TM6 bacterium RIFCSPHIGHO2_12_FULL_36_22]|nr:MAG: tRNA-guanosine(34) transglycosylase [candidate division TM6 bacterium RIFCSPHIGHO2_12_FULL_36_22]
MKNSITKNFKFELIHQSSRSKARVGRIHTPHGIIDTPNFVAVGTNATLKALDSHTADELGLQLMFCNTYHLMVQPGAELIKQAGGLHKFLNRKNPIITDSGGFQVFSLAQGDTKDELKSRNNKQNEGSVLKISEEGVLFRSYRDGRMILLTPETSVQAQKDLGADIIIPFDELPPYTISPAKLKQSLDRTHRWEKRSLDEHKRNVNNQAMYAVIHGGVNREMRKESCDYLGNLDFDGYAIGGSLGKNHQELFELLEYVVPALPNDKPNHLLGIGDLNSIEQCVIAGIDTMDCSHPTRAARHGVLFTSQGQLKLLNSSYKQDFGTIDPECECTTCKNYSRAYLQHLFKAKEITAMTLATMHNLHYMIKLMKQLREKILMDLI